MPSQSKFLAARFYRARPAAKEASTFWSKFAFILVLGYFCMSRSFAYLGLPQYSIFIGEVSITAFLLLGPLMRKAGWLWIVIHARRLRRLELLVVASLGYGAFAAYRGVLEGYGLVAALRGTAFNYYALFLVWGIWAGVRDKELLRRLARALAWCNGLYGAVFILFLNRFAWPMPGTESSPSAVALFSSGWGSAVALLGMFAFEPTLSRVWYLIVLNSLVLLGLQIRGEWLGFALGLFVFACCTKRLKRIEGVAIAGMALVAVLILMSIGDVSFPTPEGRGGGRISLNYLIARATAPIDRRLAETFAPLDTVHTFAANVDWRMNLWSSVWHDVNQSPSTAFFGLGYGYPMWTFVEQLRSKAPLQSTHNDFIYALGFTGWIGATLFVLLQLEIARLLFRSFRATGQPFGLMAWSALVTLSMFESFFESPFGAIPFFLLVGIAIAPALLRERPVQRVTYRPYAGRFRPRLPVRPGMGGVLISN